MRMVFGKTTLVFLVIILLVVLVAGACTASPAAQAPIPSQTASPTQQSQTVIKWKGQDMYGLSKYGKFKDYVGGAGPVHRLFNWVKDATNGRLVVDIAPPGGIVPAGEMFQAVSKGTIQCTGLYASVFYTGIMPEGEVDMIPCGWESTEEAWDGLYNYGIYDELQKLYAKHNLYYIPVFCNNTYNFGTTFPVDSPAAIKGKKIRASGIYAEWVRSLGGSPVTVPSAEVYMALKLGTIEGTIFSLEMIDVLKLKEIWKYYVVDPNLCTIIGCSLINLDAWKALPQDIRTIIERDSRFMLLSVAQDNHMYERYAVRDAIKEYGFKPVAWSDSDKAQVRKDLIGLWDMVAKKTPDAARIIGILKNQARALGKI